MTTNFSTNIFGRSSCPCPSPTPTSCGITHVSSDITSNTIWNNSTIWKITAEVHVLKGVTLTIQPNTRVLFLNGKLRFPRVGGLPYASLVIDSGAAIVARGVVFENESKIPNNTGGLIILGTISNSYSNQFLSYVTITSDPLVTPKFSILENIGFNYLGNNSSGINALTTFKLKGNGIDREMEGSNIGITFAGNYGVQIIGGNHTIETLIVTHSLNDTINLNEDATLNVTTNLTLLNDFITTLGPGLLNIKNNGTNQLNVSAGSQLFISGNSISETGPYTSGGSLAGWTTQTATYINNISASANTFVSYP